MTPYWTAGTARNCRRRSSRDRSLKILYKYTVILAQEFSLGGSMTQLLSSSVRISGKAGRSQFRRQVALTDRVEQQNHMINVGSAHVGRRHGIYFRCIGTLPPPSHASVSDRPLPAIRRGHLYCRQSLSGPAEGSGIATRVSNRVVRLYHSHCREPARVKVLVASVMQPKAV